MRSSFTATVLPALVLLALATWPATAAADQRDQARAHFERGSQAYREARYQDAIDAFLEAYRLDPDPVLVFNVGQAWEKLGNVPNALRSYREYLRLAPRAEDRRTVEASIRNLEARLREKGVQQVSIYSTPAGAEVIIDGKRVGQTPWTAEIAPGRHEAVLRLGSSGVVRKEFMLQPDRAMDIDVDMAKGGAGGGAATRTTAAGPRAGGPGEDAPPAPRRVRIWTWATLALSAGLLGGSLGLELARRSAVGDAKSATTQIRYQELVDSANSRQLGARVLLGTGLAVAAVGGVLLYLDLRTRKEAAAPALALGCGRDGCGFVLTRSF
ncbi:MAG: tetratricopeptide repeat protein [Deltaproteobacteria bacterium]|nr:tetratricopeptide repeat protein [Deltaproteobacteria bacterium]